MPEQNTSSMPFAVAIGMNPAGTIARISNAQTITAQTSAVLLCRKGRRAAIAAW